MANFLERTTAAMAVPEAHNLLETSRYQVQGDDNETRVTRCERGFTQHQSVKSWNRCRKHKPEAAADAAAVRDEHEELGAPRELLLVLAHSCTPFLQELLFTGAGGVKARLSHQEQYVLYAIPSTHSS